MEPFKNLISPELVGHIADQLARACDRKSANRFRRCVLANLVTLEMKDRVQSIADALLEALPDNSNERHAILRGMLHPQKGGVISLQPGARIDFSRTHKFRDVTTRRHYPGAHAVSLRINGVDTPRVDFELA